MTKAEQYAIIQKGVEAWNKWRDENPEIRINLTRANLSESNLNGINLSGARLFETNFRAANLYGANFHNSNLSGARLNKACLMRADLSMSGLNRANLRKARLNNAYLYESNLDGADAREADLTDSILIGSDLSRANLSGANLSKANLNRANLRKADFSEASLNYAYLNDVNLNETNFCRANLSGANLVGASLVATQLDNADISGCHIYGISAWDLKLHDTIQNDLIITPDGESTITVDNLEVAQFIYLLLHNEKIRYVLDTITSKVVLILGRFTPERKAILDAIRNELRKRDYLPIVFDFDKPASLGLTETVSTLSHMARFIIADITDAKSIPHELAHIVPLLPSVPIQPLIISSDYEYAMFEFIRKFGSVLEPFRYESQNMLIASLDKMIINPLEAKTTELRNPA